MLTKNFPTLLLLLTVLTLSACSSSPKSSQQATQPQGTDLLTDTPTPPNGEVGKIVGQLPSQNTALTSRSLDEPKVSIMNNSSGIITIWAVAPNNWLWGYSPFDSQSFGNLRHWFILKNENGSVSFRNAQVGTCIAAHKNGIIHTECNRNDLNQQFDFLSLTNGATALKNAANQACLSTPAFRSTLYMSLTFTRCVTEEQTTVEQQWFITPPIESANPIPITNN